MAFVISYKSFWTVITLFLFWVVFSCGRTSNTIFSVPKRKILRTNAFVCVRFVCHLSSIYYFTLTLVVDWIQNSWSFTSETFASVCNVVVNMITWTSFTFVINWIEKVWSSTSYTVIVYFDESFWTARLDLIIVPA